MRAERRQAQRRLGERRVGERGPLGVGLILGLITSALAGLFFLAGLVVGRLWHG